MKISHQVGQSINQLDNGKADRSKGSVNEKLNNPFSGDSAKVNVSDRAKTLQNVKSMATPDMDSINEAKVARLQKLIDEGNYKVDAASIADKMVDEHLIV